LLSAAAFAPLVSEEVSVGGVCIDTLASGPATVLPNQ